MIKLQLTISHFEELIKKGYSLDLLFILKLREGGEDLTFSAPKLANLEQTLIRKGLCTEDGGLTEEGKQLIAFLSSSSEAPKIARKKKEVKKEEEDMFTKWWKAYPASDTFEYKGKKFKGTRALRVKKTDCEAKIKKIVESGEYTIDELVMALRLEVSQKAENSVKTGINKMSYFQNSLTYLNQGTYDPYVELVRAGHKPEEDTKVQLTNETFI